MKCNSLDAANDGQYKATYNIDEMKQDRWAFVKHVEFLRFCSNISIIT